MRSVWIGLNDREEEGTWRWTAPLPSPAGRFWGRAQPNGTADRDEDCVSLSAGSFDGGAWSDQDCARRSGYVCELPFAP